MDIQSVVKCVRIMDYKGGKIHYTSGLTESSLAVSAVDCLDVLKTTASKQLGYVQDMYDMINMLSKSGAISNALNLTFMEEKLVYDLENYYVPVDDMIKVCKHYNIHDFAKFLETARKQINTIGVYVGDIKFDQNDITRCTDKNLSNFLDLNALASYADLNGMDTEYCYVQICDVISNIVFNQSMEYVREDLGLYYEDYLCNAISQKEYDEICLLCKVMSYMLEHCDISIEGMSIFATMVLKSMENSYAANSLGYKTSKPSTGLVKRVSTTSSKIDDGGGDYYTNKYGQDEDEAYYEPIKKHHLKTKEIENFKKNM